MIFQEIGINNIISGLNQNSNIMIDICGCNNKINISENQNIQNLTIKIIGNNNSIVIKKDIKIKEMFYDMRKDIFCNDKKNMIIILI